MDTIAPTGKRVSRDFVRANARDGLKRQRYRPRLKQRKRLPVPKLKVYLYVPVAYDHERMPVEFKDRANEAHYILHCIAARRIEKRATAEEYVNLTATILRNFIDPDYEAPVKRMLIEQGVIECDGDYRIGRKSKGYRFTTGYRGELRLAECTSSTIAAKIVAWRTTRDGKPVDIAEESLVDQYLFGCLKRLSIDMTAAERAIRDAFAKGEIKDVDSNLATSLTILLGETEFKICKQRRRHTNVTRLCSVARDCLTVDGRRLVCAGDISNSQPVFFAMLLTKKRTEAECPYATDEKRFIRLVMKGRLYDYLMAKCGWDKGRREFKDELFKYVFYGEAKWYIHNHPLAVLFKERFPTVFQFIVEQKRFDHKSLPRDMQRAEAEFMIEQVCPRLAKDHPGVIAITVHDSIYTHPEHCPLVYRIMTEEFDKLGIQPTIKADWDCN